MSLRMAVPGDSNIAKDPSPFLARPLIETNSSKDG